MAPMLRSKRSRGNEGASSSQARQGEETRSKMAGDFNVHRFRNLSCMEWYNASIRNVIVVERCISKKVDKALGITPLFRMLGWESILNLGDEYYPTLVCEFYANLREVRGNDSPDIVSYVRGVTIKLTPRRLGEILGLPYEGNVRVLRGSIENDETFPGLEAACDRLKIPSVPRGDAATGRYYRKINVAKPRVFALSYILSHNVTPKSSGFSEARLSEVYHIHCMMCGTFGQLNLPSHILYNMQDIRQTQVRGKAFGYPLVLQKVFEYFNVPFPLEGNEKTKANNLVTDFTLSVTLKMRLDHNGVWQPYRPNDRHQGIVDAVLAEREDDLPELDYVYVRGEDEWTTDEEEEEEEERGEDRTSLHEEEEAEGAERMEEERPAPPRAHASSVGQGAYQYPRVQSYGTIQQQVNDLSTRFDSFVVEHNNQFQHIDRHLTATQTFMQTAWHNFWPEVDFPVQYPPPYNQQHPHPPPNPEDDA